MDHCVVDYTVLRSLRNELFTTPQEMIGEE